MHGSTWRSRPRAALALLALVTGLIALPLAVPRAAEAAAPRSPASATPVVAAEGEVAPGEDSVPTAVGTVPGPPSAVAAVAGGALLTADVSWVPPVSDGGSPITGYVVVYSPGTDVSVGVSTATTVINLEANTTYRFLVAAKNANGTGAFSGPSAPFKTASLPTQPTNVHATITGPVSAEVTWSLPSATGGTPITGWEVHAFPGAFLCGTDPDVNVLVATCPSLERNTAYVFQVQAKNAIGAGPLSADSNAVTTPTLAPAALTVTATLASPTSATVTWSAPPNDGGSPVNTWIVHSFPSGGCTPAPDLAARTATCNSLLPNQVHTFRVEGVTGAGHGTVSADSNTVRTPTVPGPPRNVVATRTGSATATVTWDAPLSNGGAFVNAWTVTTFPGGGNCVVNPNVAARTASCGPLLPGRSFEFRVVGHNPVGAGESSAASNAVTSPTVPSAPTNVVLAQATPTTLSVTWAAPASDGGTPITGWRATVFPSGAECTVDPNPALRTATCFGAGGVANRVLVFGVNVVGHGSFSAASNAVTPPPPVTISVMPAPATVTATKSAWNTVQVSWASVANTTGYYLYRSPGGFVTATTGTSFSNPLPDVAGVSYQYFVQSLGGSSASYASVFSNAVSQTAAPGAPATPTVTLSSWDHATVDWPDVPGALGYDVYRSPGTLVSSPTASTFIDTLPVADVDYSYTVAVRTESGTSVLSAASPTIQRTDPPGPPASVTVAATSWNGVRVDWPDVPGATDYWVYRSPGGFIGAAGATSQWDTALPMSNVDFRFFVVAFTETGASRPSPSSAPIQRTDPPSPPASVTAVLADTDHATVTWSPVAGASSYFVFSDHGYVGFTAATTFGALLPVPGTSYRFRVEAVTETGTSLPSSFSADVTPIPPAAAVLGVDATPIDNDSAAVSWTAVVTDPLTPVTQYEVFASPGGFRGVTALTSFTANGLPDADQHTFFVRAVTAGGGGLLLSCVQASCATGTPTIASHTPASIGNTGEATIAFVGQNLQGVDDLQLTRPGATVTSIALVVSPSGESVKARVDLGGAATGTWTMALRRAGGSAIAAGTIDVAATGKPVVDVALTGRDTVLLGFPTTFTVTATNRGNIDALLAPVNIGGIPVDAVVRPLFSLANPLPPLVHLPPAPSQTVDMEDGTKFMPIVLARMRPGESRDLRFQITPVSPVDFDLQVWSNQCMGDDVKGFVAGASVAASEPGARAGTPPMAISNEAANCLKSLIGALASEFADFITDTAPFAECAKTAIGLVKNQLVDFTNDNLKNELATSGTDLMLSTVDVVITCAQELVPVSKGFKTAVSLAKFLWNAIKQVSTVASGCYYPTSTQPSKHVKVVSARDPNMKSGPPGAGVPQYIQTNAALGYEIHFENQPSATAPAHVVAVSDTLDPATFDLSTLKLGSLTFGDEVVEPPASGPSWHQTVDMRPAHPFLLRVDAGIVPATGLLTWVVTTLDPETGAQHEDPFVGFLPPNNESNDGQGGVSFTVMPKNPTHGKVITNKASIVFDANAPIVTNTWSNTIDATAPTATVTPLPATTTDATVDVAWSGADTGSGIGAYSTFVSVDGGPFDTWIGSTTATSGTYVAAPGHTYGFAVRAVDNAGNFAALPAAAATTVKVFHTGSFFNALAPVRILDSRTGVGGFGGKLGAGAGSVKQLQVTGGTSGVPAEATAVVMNVTATAGTLGSFLTVYPSGSPLPVASNVNFGVGQTIPNLVTVRIGTGGKVTFFNAAGAVDVVADVVGYYDDGYTPEDRFNALAPVRALDSRGATGGWASSPLGAGAGNVKTLDIDALAAVPATATAVIMNVTATGGSNGSFLTVYPTGAASVPTASNVNFGAGETIPNLVTVKLGTDGQVTFFNAVGTVHVVADVVGYYDPAAGDLFKAINPTRALDSRGSTGGWGSKLLAGVANTRSLPIAGVTAGVPADATAVVANTTVTGSTAGSFLTVYPTGAASVPVTSNLNFAAGQTIPNLVVSKLGTGGQLQFFNAVGATDVVVDVTGYFAAG